MKWSYSPRYLKANDLEEIFKVTSAQDEITNSTREMRANEFIV